MLDDKGNLIHFHSGGIKVFAKQTFEPRLMLPLSLSYDHRVINGADAAVFTRYVASLLADPRKILL